MAVDLFQRRAMARMLQQLKPPRTFIRDTFFANREFYDAEAVDVDIDTESRKMASFVSPHGVAPVSDRQGYETKTFVPPIVANKRLTRAGDLANRLPGEDLYESLSPEERAAKILTADLAALDNMTTRREEWMSVRALFDGSIHVVGDDVDATINFGRLASHNIPLLAAARCWTHADSQIIEDLMTWRRLCVKDSGEAPTDGVLGTEAADALLKNANLKTMLDTTRIDMGLIAPEIMATPGVTYLGRLKGTGLDLWAYDEWYVDPVDGVEKPMVPAKEIALASRRAYTALRYGAVGVATGTDDASSLTLSRGARIPESWVEKEPAGRIVKVSARPLPVPVQVNSMVRVVVVA